MQTFSPSVRYRTECFYKLLLRQGHDLTRFLAISATYELIEWAAAVALGQGADEFLGTQGDPWDTQSDMFLALIGAVTALLLFSRIHDRQIEDVQSHEHAT